MSDDEERTEVVHELDDGYESDESGSSVGHVMMSPRPAKNNSAFVTGIICLVVGLLLGGILILLVMPAPQQPSGPTKKTTESRLHDGISAINQALWSTTDQKLSAESKEELAELVEHVVELTHTKVQEHDAVQKDRDTDAPKLPVEAGVGVELQPHMDLKTAYANVPRYIHTGHGRHPDHIFEWDDDVDDEFACYGEGYLYYASGDRPLWEASISASRLREMIPEGNITIVVDQINYDRLDTSEAMRGKPFDMILLQKPLRVNASWHAVEPNGFAGKINSLLYSPYQKTILMDGDTYMCHPNYLRQLFPALDEFEVMAPFTAVQWLYGASEFPIPFEELSTGLMAVRKTKTMVNMMFDWVSETTYPGAAKLLNVDQAPLMHVLYRSRARVWVLNYHYQCLQRRCGDYFIDEENLKTAKYQCVLIHSHKAMSEGMGMLTNSAKAQVMAKRALPSLPMPYAREP